MKLFEKLEPAPPDAIFGLTKRFVEDPRPDKINLIAGVYKTAELKPLILQCVKEAEFSLLQSETSKDYLPIDGMAEYVKNTGKLVFGILDSNIYGAQTAGGTAALRTGGRFLKEHGLCKIYVSDPTWDNHNRIFTQAGLELQTYPYFDRQTNGFDFKGMLEHLDRIEKGSIILLHGCCHNPTGCDPTPEQWRDLVEKIREKEVFPFIDFAYQGFGEEIVQDAYSVRLFLEAGVEFAVAVSHSKNFGLYAERCGALFFVCDSSLKARSVGSHIKVIIRGMYSNPPCHGARIVNTILQDKTLKTKWEQELSAMRQRIFQMRKLLAKQLKSELGSDHFDFLLQQKGMFSYTGLDAQVVQKLLDEYAIYLAHDARINVAGLAEGQINAVAKAICMSIHHEIDQ